MNFLGAQDTIIAVSSSQLSNAAIAIIRLSGFDTLEVFKNSFALDINKIEPRYAHFTKIIEREKTLDEIVLTYFKAPHSYNGENILELSVHGNKININRILDFFIQRKIARLAKPGEFTYRALRNKKLNLSQVEGLDLFLNANSSYALDQGFSLLSGSLKESFSELYTAYLNHKSALELAIDFSDDIGEETAKKAQKETFQKFFDLVNKLYLRVNNREENLMDPEVVLYGKPNAGKSSLFNLLLKEERAIVNEKKGTTRDYLKEALYYKGHRFSLVDTAGLRDSSDEIENEGIDKAKKLSKNAFLKVLVINPFDFSLEDFKKVEIRPDIVVFSHADKANFEKKQANCLKLLKSLAESGSIEPTGPIGPKCYSLVLSDQNSDNYLELLEEFVISFQKRVGDKPILLERHRDSIKNIYMNSQNYQEIYQSNQDIAIIASELNILGHCLSELLGIVSSDDVLSNVFDNFCIGK